MDRQDQAAIEWVQEHGAPFERWRVRRLLGVDEPLPAGWAEGQNPDGGWRKGRPEQGART